MISMGLLEEFSGWFVYGVLGMRPADALAHALDFFIYDSIKVLLLLAVMIFLVSVARTFITRKRIREMLGGKKEGVGNILAALLGIPTPFCSCSAVPIFMGFVEAGIPLGVTFSFLIASPMINEVAIALLLGMFGWEVTALYIGAGLIIAIVAGIIIGRLGLEWEVEEFVHARAKKAKGKKMRWKERLLHEKMHRALAEHQEASYAYSSFKFGFKTFTCGAFSAERLRQMPYITTTSLIRAKDFPGFDGSLKKFQDWDVWLTMLAQNKTGIWMPEVLFSVVPRKSGMSSWLPSFVHKMSPSDSLSSLPMGKTRGSLGRSDVIIGALPCLRVDVTYPRRL